MNKKSGASTRRVLSTFMMQTKTKDCSTSDSSEKKNVKAKGLATIDENELGNRHSYL